MWRHCNVNLFIQVGESWNLKKIGMFYLQWSLHQFENTYIREIWKSIVYTDPITVLKIYIYLPYKNTRSLSRAIYLQLWTISKMWGFFYSYSQCFAIQCIITIELPPGKKIHNKSGSYWLISDHEQIRHKYFVKSFASARLAWNIRYAVFKHVFLIDV